MLQAAKIFQNGMVLQRDREVCVWGKTNVGNKITVMIQGKVANATADKDGNWKAALPSLQTFYREILTIAAEKERNW